MEASLQEISKEIIKPASETPPHLAKLKLSYLDQISPPTYIPMIFFYQADESRGLTSSHHTQISHHLKQSLSDTLTLFYPLAGRINVDDRSVLDCNDAGAEFIEARVQAPLNDVLQEPITEQLKHLMPGAGDATAGARPGAALVAVKITFFNCGGMAVGVCVWHKVADLASAMTFLNAWAASCRGSEAEVSRFTLDLANYFPPGEFPDSDTAFLRKLTSNKEKIMTERFVFNMEKLEALKQAAATSPSGSNVKNPTRVELVSAFIWKHLIDAAKSENPETKKTFAASHAVNLRGRTSPPLVFDNVFGNCFMSTTALSDASNAEFHDLVAELRRAIKKVNEDYITKAKTGDGYLNDLYKLVSPIMNGELELCAFSSWCRYPVYEVDYGWGNPISFCTSFAPLKNSIILVNSRSGDGIEALITMSQLNLEILETQIKLLSSTPTQIIS